MSTTQTERHVFRNIPLHASGNAVMARVSGEVTWKIGEQSDGWQLFSLRDLYVHCEDGSSVEIPEDDAIWVVLREALLDELRSTPKRSADLDKSVTEGAQQTSG
jgi:hypothetical protein